MITNLIILGSGGYGRTVLDIAEQLGYNTIVLDDADSQHPLSSFVTAQFSTVHPK